MYSQRDLDLLVVCQMLCPGYVRTLRRHYFATLATCTIPSPIWAVDFEKRTRTRLARAGHRGGAQVQSVHAPMWAGHVGSLDGLPMWRRYVAFFT